MQSGEEVDLLIAHQAPVDSVSFSPDGKTLASIGRHSRIGLWDIETGDLKHTIISSYPVESVAFSSDGQTLASGSWDNTICLWDVDTGNLKNIFNGHQDNIDGIGPPTNVYSVAFSPSGQMLVSRRRDTIYVWDTSTFVPNTEEIKKNANSDGVSTSKMWCELQHTWDRMFP